MSIRPLQYFFINTMPFTTPPTAEIMLLRGAEIAMGPLLSAYDGIAASGQTKPADQENWGRPEAAELLSNRKEFLTLSTTGARLACRYYLYDHFNTTLRSFPSRRPMRYCSESR